MRILIAHESPAGAGGVESYLASLMPALVARGHQLAFLHHDSRNHGGSTALAHPGMPSISVADQGLPSAIESTRAWGPDVCFSHNMRQLEIDAALASEWPTVKMMHGYFGTCVSAQKAHAFPSVRPCARTFGNACLALYLPRHCGRLRPVTMLEQFSWASRQRALLPLYAQLVVASDHMAAEYRNHGVPGEQITSAPLFSTLALVDGPRPLPAEPTILFAGRMTPLKGGEALVRAVAAASRAAGQPLRLLIAGDGPELVRLRALVERLGVDAEFTGWVTGEERLAVFRRATIVAVPSLWPEPFGLVGLEAAAQGVPAVAFDVGGISQWLHDDENGRLVRDVGNSEAFGEAIAALVQSPSDLQRLGRGALRVARELGVASHLDVLERVFARAVRRGRVLA
jgi:glycosyltransferase involved in cell wall biosynthesis